LIFAANHIAGPKTGDFFESFVPMCYFMLRIKCKGGDRDAI